MDEPNRPNQGLCARDFPASAGAGIRDGAISAIAMVGGPKAVRTRRTVADLFRSRTCLGRSTG